tara:strand:+ start:11 stop:700 length:690 start_codon:yes stop_codon:yes gene_type:complete
MKISIIIPCYNEIDTIEEIVNRVKAEMPNSQKEIIIIDDYSDDGTKELLKKDLLNKVDKIIFNERNYGKGYSLRKAIECVTGDIVIIQDADLEYSPSEYPALLKPILENKADVVYGTRFSYSHERKVHFFWHTIANKILTLICNIRTNLNLTDMEVGFKVFKSNVIKDLKLEENSFGFEPEITIKIAKKKLSIYEVGISYYGRSYEQGKKITLKDAYRALYIILFKYYN